MSNDRYMDHMHDIILSAKDVKSFIKKISKKDFEKDKKTVYATTRAIKIIGDASKKIPPNIRSKYPEIPWKQIAGMKDKLIYDYFGVDVGVL
jgi:uncharacterized protein with HEPN domain